MVMCLINPFKSNGLPNPYKLDRSISNFRVVWWYFTIELKECSVSKQ